MWIYLFCVLSLAVNILLGWYVKGLLQKFMFISQNVADLYLTTKAFRVFVTSLYSMDSYYGEPMIQEHIERIREVNEEIEAIRDVFQYMLDEELEAELDAAEEEEE